MTSDITLIEVGPRDGLQNESSILSTKVKAEYIKLLLKSGIENLEVSSFVKSDRIPQMGDAKELAKLFKKFNQNLIYLVPNLRGLEFAISAKVKSIAVFTATSESFNKKNINATIQQSLDNIFPVIQSAIQKKMYIRGYISTAFGCPYQGKTSEKTLIQLCGQLFQAGVNEVSIGDTIGVATMAQVKSIISLLKKEFDLSKIAFHFHDTQKKAVQNSLLAYELGISRFDGSSGGLGGCPYAKGATGNVATEDLLEMFNQQGVKTGINLEQLIEASRYILKKLNKKSTSQYLLRN